MPITAAMPVYKDKDEKRPRIWKSKTLSQGAQETKIEMDLHTGTHMDAPSHMIADAQGIDSGFAWPFLFEGVVLDLSAVDKKITAAELEKQNVPRGAFVLLKTRNSDTEKFDPQFVYLDQSGARLLADRGARGVGIDALGIERDQPDHATHRILFEKNILVLEGLRLADVAAGAYILFAAPLLIPDADAAPMRAFLIPKEG